MLTKIINVSGPLKTAGGQDINVNFNYRSTPDELTAIDFNFNKEQVNVYGSYNVFEKKIQNYSVNNGLIDTATMEDVADRLEVLAANPEADNLYVAEV